jgi:hypothetical protein
MKYLKKFNQHSLYENYALSSDFVKPNVSLCLQEDEVHYSQYVPIYQTEYIESSGSNHIIIPLTHFPVLTNTNDKYFKIYVKYNLINYGNDCNRGYTLLHLNDNDSAWYYSIFDDNNDIKIVHIFDKENNWQEINNRIYTNEHIIYENTEYTWLRNWHNAKINVFGWEDTSNHTIGYHSIARLYELKIWDNNDNLIMHLVPYKNDLTNEVYIHDNITNNDYHFEQ